MSKRPLHWSLRTGQAAFGLIMLALLLVATALVGPQRDDFAAKVARMAPASRADLIGVDSTREALVEGRVSAKNEALTQSLVAYTRERAVRDIRDDIVWSPDEQQTPPLLVDLADGPIDVVGSYTLLGTLPTTIVGDYRYAGITAGDSIIVIGQVMPGPNRVTLSADYILRGTRADYTRSRWNLLPIAVGVGLMGVGIMIMAWLLKRGYSPFGDPRTGRRA